MERTGNHIGPSDYVSFGSATSEGYLTNAGKLFADQHIVYNSRIFCTRWSGNEKGSMIHRSYLLPGSKIHIDMYADRLEIVSPGGMIKNKYQR